MFSLCFFMLLPLCGLLAVSCWAGLLSCILALPQRCYWPLTYAGLALFPTLGVLVILGREFWAVSVSGFVFSYFSLPRVNLPQIRCLLSRFVRCLVCILILVASDAYPVGGKAKYRNGIMPRVSCSITPLVLFAWLPIPSFLSPIPCALTPEASVLSSVCWRESERKKKRSCFLLAEGARGKSLR